MKKEDANKAMKMLVLETKRSNNDSFKRVKGPITAESIARRHELKIEKVEEVLLSMAEEEKKTVRIAVENQLGRKQAKKTALF